MEKRIDYPKNIQNIQLRDGVLKFSEIKNEFFYLHITPQSGLIMDFEKEPTRINGALIILFHDCPEFELSINNESFAVKPNSVIFIFPGSLVMVKQSAYLHTSHKIDYEVLFLSVPFLQNININMSTIPMPAVKMRAEWVRNLNKDEFELISRYFELIYINSSKYDNRQVSKNIAANLIAAMIYQLIQFYHKRLAELPEEGNTSTSRRNEYVREFVRLLQIHFASERSVNFYAEKLFISPKYLSLLVKETTGRSASCWIDDFVIMEAKNMLRFSGKNIQQVAYALNFSTQSSFGKYFKHLTGMSPTEYQKS